MVFGVRPPILPLLRLFICPSPVYQKAEPRQELFPTLCYAPLGLYNFFGQKLQEEGKDLEASIELYLEKNG